MSTQRQYNPLAIDSEVLTIAREWGWSNPSKGVLVTAKQARDIAPENPNRLQSVEFLVSLGIVNKDQGEAILAKKPAGIQTITWFSQQDNISVPMERVFALMSGYPYYESLSILTVHPKMGSKEVIKRAEEIDAALMIIEDTVPVLIFSTFSALLQYKALGRAEQMQDAILRHTPILKLAVGARDEISAVLKSLRTDDLGGSLESANVWNAEAAENKSKPENREFTRLLDHALKQGATDISFKPFRSGDIQIQMRKYGQMMSPKAVSGRLGPEMGSRIINLLQAKSGANPSGTIQRTPMDGQITYRSAVGDAFLRLSFIPLNHLGELRNLTSVSIRLLPRSESSVKLTDLDLAETVVEQINFATRMSQGLLLVVGPTNSGKSTTVAGCIGEHVKIFGDTQKRISVEDPVERFLFGITQINVPIASASVAGNDNERFGIILRAIKRHDPDMINIGEVRDKETADLCVASASTGHLVLSTLHANHTVMGFDVLAKTVEPDKRFQLIESLSMIIAQRLVKIVCPHCSTISRTTAEEKSIFARYLKTIGEEAHLPETMAHAKQAIMEHDKVIHPAGCAKCAHDGYIGLRPINEVLPFSRTVKDAAIEMLAGINRRNTLAEARTITLLQSGLALLNAHQIELNDLLV